MLNKFLNLLSPSKTSARTPSLPANERVYAIGDIHGRLDLFEALLRKIEQDEKERPDASTTIVLLGDLIDRGPESAGVLARARSLSQSYNVEILSGNHEEMLLASLEDESIMRAFLRFGGLETLLSYGLDAEEMADASLQELQEMAKRHIPSEDLEFIAGFKKMVPKGDYIFVHAGLRPGVPPHLQLMKDCRWIREPFLSHEGDFGGFVVHGHTIAEEPDLRLNRLGIDTGAYIHGTLTAVGLEQTDRWFLSASEQDAQMRSTVAA